MLRVGVWESGSSPHGPSTEGFFRVGGRWGGGPAHSVLSCSSVPEFAGSSVAAAFSTHEQAVPLQLLLVLNAAWRELWPSR